MPGPVGHSCQRIGYQRSRISSVRKSIPLFHTFTDCLYLSTKCSEVSRREWPLPVRMERLSANDDTAPLRVHYTMRGPPQFQLRGAMYWRRWRLQLGRWSILTFDQLT